MTANAVKIPENHYVTFQKRNGDDLPLAFMTPDGTDSAAQKRKATATNWAYRGNTPGPDDLPPQTFENKLLIGFSFVRSIKRYAHFGSGNVVWRIADPRGFELEISSANLAEIMRTSTIERGEIQSRCIWGRSGADNVLIPEESELYQEALKTTQLTKTSVSAREVKIGNLVSLQNGLSGVYYGAWYLGRFTLYAKSDFYGSNSTNQQTIEPCSNSKYHFFCTEHFPDGTPKKFTIYASPKFATRSTTDTIDVAEAERRINTALNSGGSVDSPTSVYGVDFVADSLESIKNAKVVLEPLDMSNPTTLDKINKNEWKSIIVVNIDNVWAIANRSCYGRHAQPHAQRPHNHHVFIKELLLNGRNLFVQETLRQERTNYYGSNTYFHTPVYLKEDFYSPTLKHFIMLVELPSKYNTSLRYEVA